MKRWYGTVTVNNTEEVAGMIRELLEGHKFTTVYCYEYKNFEPEVRLHQQLQGGRSGINIHVTHHHKEKPDRSPHSQLTICDTYGVGGFSTTQVESGYDHEFNAPYVVINERRRGQMRFTARAPNGKLMHALFAVEDI